MAISGTSIQKQATICVVTNIYLKRCKRWRMVMCHLEMLKRKWYNLLLTKERFDLVNSRCLLRTKSQDKHFEFGSTYRKRFFLYLKDQVLHLKEKLEHLTARVEMERNQMYNLNLRSIRETCLQVNVEDKALLWHWCFGHLHHTGLRWLAKKNMVHVLPDIDYEGIFCEECVLSKKWKPHLKRR